MPHLPTRGPTPERSLWRLEVASERLFGHASQVTFPLYFIKEFKGLYFE